MQTEAQNTQDKISELEARVTRLEAIIVAQAQKQSDHVTDLFNSAVAQLSERAGEAEFEAKNCDSTCRQELLARLGRTFDVTWTAVIGTRWMIRGRPKKQPCPRTAPAWGMAGMGLHM